MFRGAERWLEPLLEAILVALKLPVDVVADGVVWDALAPRLSRRNAHQNS